MSDSFIGSWLVSEYVYDPDGSPVGVVKQRRQLERLSGGRLRVIQDCEPAPSLSGHPMERFAGHHEFTLSVEDNLRRYGGPAVIGSGLALGPKAIVGRGMWPNFGHNFTSYGVVPAMQLQLTGGKFFVASEMVANVVGVAIPDGGDDAWPTLTGPEWPGEVSPSWAGQASVVTTRGAVVARHEVVRDYRPGAFEERSDAGTLRVTLESGLGGYQLTGYHAGQAQRGVAKRYGPLLESEWVRDEGVVADAMEVLDGARGHLVCVERLHRDHVVHGYRVVCLRPSGAA